MYNRHAGMSHAGSPHDTASIYLVFWVFSLYLPQVANEHIKYVLLL